MPPARQAALPPEAYGEEKDVNEAWAAEVLAGGDGSTALAVSEILQEL